MKSNHFRSLTQIAHENNTQITELKLAFIESYKDIHTAYSHGEYYVHKDQVKNLVNRANLFTKKQSATIKLHIPFDLAHNIVDSSKSDID